MTVQRRPERHPLIRISLLAVGGLMILCAPLVAPFPGPGGTILFGGGLILVLRNSRWARRRFARWKRRWPKLGALSEHALRRRSWHQRRARDKDRQAQQAANLQQGLR